MKKPIPPLSDPNARIEAEIARRHAASHVRDAARILTDVMQYVPFEDRAAYTKVVGELTAAEQHLTNLVKEP